MLPEKSNLPRDGIIIVIIINETAGSLGYRVRLNFTRERVRGAERGAESADSAGPVGYRKRAR